MILINENVKVDLRNFEINDAEPTMYPQEVEASDVKVIVDWNPPLAKWEIEIVLDFF